MASPVCKQQSMYALVLGNLIRESDYSVERHIGLKNLEFRCLSIAQYARGFVKKNVSSIASDCNPDKGQLYVPRKIFISEVFSNCPVNHNIRVIS